MRTALMAAGTLKMKKLSCRGAGGAAASLGVGVVYLDDKQPVKNLTASEPVIRKQRCNLADAKCAPGDGFARRMKDCLETFVHTICADLLSGQSVDHLVPRHSV